MFRRSIGAGIVIALMAVAQALAQSGREQGRPPEPGPHPGDQVTFCGKVVALVEDGCVGIVGIGTRPTVELSAVHPKPEVGTTIEGTGVIAGGVNKCMQGVHLESASYGTTAYCSASP